MNFGKSSHPPYKRKKEISKNNVKPKIKTRKSQDGIQGIKKG